MNLPELLVKSRNINPQKGNIVGRCFVCGKKTNFGHRIKDTISGTFTKYNYLTSGDCSCPTCFELFNDQVYRRKSWLCTKSEFRIFDKEQKKKVLYDLPEPPFFIHIAMIGQKQPWVECVNTISYSRNTFIFTHENYGSVWFDRKKWETYDTLVKKVLSYKIGKMQLKYQFHMKTWENASKYGFENLLKEIEKCKKNLLWEVCVDVN